MSNEHRITDIHEDKITDLTEAHAQAENKAENNLPALIKKWQTKLKLDHWKLKYELCDRDKIGQDYYGKVQMDTSHCSADILFLTESEFDKLTKSYLIPEKYNLEDTVVHELLHIFLRGMRDASKEMEEEKVIYILTRILLKQDRAYNDLNEKYDECVK